MTHERRRQTVPPEQPTPGLAARVVRAAAPELAALRERGRRRARRGLFAAAALLLAVPLLHELTRSPQPAPAAPGLAGGAGAGVRTEAAWLAERLRTDGSFDPESWGGPRGETLAMHGLALLALVRADDAGTHRDDLLRGADWLIGHQSPDGSFDAAFESTGVPSFGAPVATLALLEVWHRTGDAAVGAAAARAARSLAGERLADADGRGFLPVSPPTPVEIERWSWCRLALGEAARRGLPHTAALQRLETRLATALPAVEDTHSKALPSLALGPSTRATGLGPLHSASVSILAALSGPADSAY